MGRFQAIVGAVQLLKIWSVSAFLKMVLELNR